MLFWPYSLTQIFSFNFNCRGSVSLSLSSTGEAFRPCTCGRKICQHKWRCCLNDDHRESIAHHNSIALCHSAVASAFLRAWWQQICTSISCLIFPCSQILCWGTGHPSSTLLLLIFFGPYFFLFWLTDPKSENAYDDKQRKKKDGLVCK